MKPEGMEHWQTVPFPPLPSEPAHTGPQPHTRPIATRSTRPPTPSTPSTTAVSEAGREAMVVQGPGPDIETGESGQSLLLGLLRRAGGRAEGRRAWGEGRGLR